jgi:hypothetical protein
MPDDSVIFLAFKSSFPKSKYLQAYKRGLRSPFFTHYLKSIAVPAGLVFPFPAVNAPTSAVIFSVG